jgi:hypothetical protein
MGCGKFIKPTLLVAVLALVVIACMRSIGVVMVVSVTIMFVMTFAIFVMTMTFFTVLAGRLVGVIDFCGRV